MAVNVCAFVVPKTKVPPLTLANALITSPEFKTETTVQSVQQGREFDILL